MSLIRSPFPTLNIINHFHQSAWLAARSVHLAFHSFVFFESCDLRAASCEL